MKKVLLLAFLLLPALAYSQEHQVGVRLGEPLGITYKTFIDERISLEGIIGAAGANHAGYYRRAFNNNRPTGDAVYASHSTYSAFSLNARAAYHEDITNQFNITEGMLWAYGGVGAQLRSVQVDYLYSRPMSPTFFNSENRTNIDFGPEAFVGTEYYFQDLPISVFVEAGLFLELIDRPGHLRLQGAIGARYIF
ncbi:hypothetical protein KI659_06800 [Litoribacter alkaliphilus]|uniref:Outer membrane beta-barrel protein n=1 Tax=Litoribacter ruber TaxID=702568 RepID=A0AAP2CFN6_9BACT|nr:hypothetical protein [Litoribacter alkaliphilus]MBS9523726.1 hypothetical protein [Litoribacter alkaliphilus]